MKKEILAVLVIIAGFALIQTVKLGQWSGKDLGHVLVSADDQTFPEKLSESGEWALVKFWAPWCGACRKLMPTVKALAEERQDQLRVIAVNVDEAPNVTGRFGVRPIPCLVLLHNGTEIDRMVGIQPAPVLGAWIDGHVTRNTTALK